MENMLLKRIKQLRNKYETEGSHIIGISGSYARGEAKDHSDISVLCHVDQLFILQNKELSAFHRLTEIRQELSRELSIDVNIISLEGLSRTAMKYILKDIRYV